MSGSKFPSPGHLDWMIGGRAKNQMTSLDLYELIKDRTDALPQLGLSDGREIRLVFFISDYTCSCHPRQNTETRPNLLYSRDG